VDVLGLVLVSKNNLLLLFWFSKVANANICLVFINLKLQRQRWNLETLQTLHIYPFIILMFQMLSF
jgi:hypothetical protein